MIDGPRSLGPPKERALPLSLIVTTCSRAFALPVADVIETMRPLPTNPLAGVPAFVLGVSVVRGHAVPVVDLGVLSGAGESGTARRFVFMRSGRHGVVTTVEAVLGVRQLDAGDLQAPPPLLRDASTDVVESIGVLDDRLLLVLRASHLVPEELWARLSTGESRP
jgi:purine-binding chemotaxis protein CheW